MNNKPRYTEGTTRYQIVNLMHISGVTTPRALSLFDNPSIPNVMVKLRKEGVVEKSHNEEVFENLNLQTYNDNLEEFFYDNIPDDNIEFFSKYGENDIKRAKYNKGKLIGNSRRIVRNGEAIAMMCASGIPTLPDEKKYVVKDKTLTDNVYYQSREIKRYTGYADDVESESDEERTVIATRINGALLSAGGNYNIYHLGKDITTWSTQGEYKFKNFLQNMLTNYINKTSCMVDNALLYVYDLMTFLKVVNPSKNVQSRYDALNMTYDNLYVLPFDKNGRDMTKIMVESDWQIRMYEMIMEEKYEDTSRLDFVCDYYDGEVYTFIFCVPNLSRYLDFVRKVKFVNDKDKFRVVCFDYQVDFVTTSVGKYAKVLKADFKDFVDDWFH